MSAPKPHIGLSLDAVMLHKLILDNTHTRRRKISIKRSTSPRFLRALAELMESDACFGSVNIRIPCVDPDNRRKQRRPITELAYSAGGANGR
jgi:hypothetical protein